MGKRILFNLLFWNIYCIIVAFFYSGYAGFARSLHFSVILVFFQALFTYTNLYILIPVFLKRKHIILYILSTILVIGILSIVRFQIPSLLGEVTRRQIGLRSRIVFFEFHLLLAYSLSTAYYFIIEWFKNTQTKAELKFQQVESELKYLRNQINPHFLFNTLNNIYTLCYLKDDKAAPSVLKLSEMMRYMLHESNSSRIELEREVQFIRNYLELQKLKKEDAMQITFDVKGVKGRHKIAPLVLIAFFENCFKHGDIETNPSGWIKAELSVNDDNELILFVGNSKRQAAKIQENRKHVGLDNVRNRLALLYNTNYQLKICDEDIQYRIYLTIKLEE
ncbi:MAG TPA: histidine kinase [Bacteroidales bacterium]|nr:histidine kinase [Bacteroidales bacterium]